MKYLAIPLIVLAAVSSFQPARCQEEDEKLTPRQEIEQLELEREKAEITADIRMKELGVRKAELEIEHHQKRMKHHRGCGCFLVFIMCAIINILLTVWVYKDNKQRDAGQGIWIPIVLLTGLFGVIPYTIVRLGDEKSKK